MADEAVVRFVLGQASLTDQGWFAADPLLARALNKLYPYRGQESGADPNPIATLAERAAEEFDGEVLAVPPTESEKGIVY